MTIAFRTLRREDAVMVGVALLFPGQGAQHPAMAVGLYGHERVFTDTMDEVFAALGHAGDDVRADWLAERPRVPVDHVTRSQILLFGVNLALGRTVLDWGVRPVGLLGHSVGEMSAATLAGVYPLDVAARLMWERVTALAGAPVGAMLAVAGTAAEVGPYLSGDVVVGAVNAPRQLVLAGGAEAVDRVREALSADGFTCRPVPSTTAFHSPALAGFTESFVPGIAAAGPRPPRVPIYSAYTGDLLADRGATDPRYWAGHPAEPVLFWSALERLVADRAPDVLLDAGPGRFVSTLARRHPAVRSRTVSVLAMLPGRPSGPEADRDALREVAERLA